MKFYKNDVVFNTSKIDNLPIIFIFSFILPITYNAEGSSSGFFEYYSDEVETVNSWDLNVDIRIKLRGDYFEEIYNQTSSRHIWRKYYSRKYILALES